MEEWRRGLLDKVSNPSRGRVVKGESVEKSGKQSPWLKVNISVNSASSSAICLGHITRAVGTSARPVKRRDICCRHTA